MKVDSKTRKLKSSIIKITEKAKDNFQLYKRYTVYGVTKDEGISLTGNVTSEDLSEYIVVGENTFAFNPYRVNIGSIGLSDKNFKGLVSPAYVVFQTKKDLLPEFFFHFLKSDTGIKLINWYGNRGGVRNALRFDDLGEIDIPDLSIEEQRGALLKIDNAKRSLDILNNELNLQQTYLQQLHQCILQEAVQGKLTQQNPRDEPASKLLERIKAEKQRLIKATKNKKVDEIIPIETKEIPYSLPIGWVWCRLGEMFEVVRGSSPRPKGDKRYFSKERTPFHWISIADFAKHGKNSLLKDTSEFLTEEGIKFGRLVTTNDLLIAASGVGSVGKSSRLDINGYIYDGLLAIKNINNETLMSFIAIFIKVKELEIYSIAAGTNWLNINTSILRNYLFPLPPLSEQQRIVIKVQQLLQMVNQLEQQVQQSQTQVQQLLQAILKEAFSNNANAYEENEMITMAAEE